MANEKKPRTAQVCRDLALPVLEELGLTLWDLRFEKEGADWYLRYFIDKEGGVNIQDCEAFSRAVDKLLDEADPIEQSYTLEVSSPGIERKLTRDEHFARYVGHPVRLRLIRPHPEEKSRDFTGELLGKTEAGISLRLPDGRELCFAADTVANAHLAVEF